MAESERSKGIRELKQMMSIDKNERAGGYTTLQNLSMGAASRISDVVPRGDQPSPQAPEHYDGHPVDSVDYHTGDRTPPVR